MQHPSEEESSTSITQWLIIFIATVGVLLVIQAAVMLGRFYFQHGGTLQEAEATIAISISLRMVFAGVLCCSAAWLIYVSRWWLSTAMLLLAAIVFCSGLSDR